MADLVLMINQLGIIAFIGFASLMAYRYYWVKIELSYIEEIGARWRYVSFANALWRFWIWDLNKLKRRKEEVFLRPWLDEELFEDPDERYYGTRTSTTSSSSSTS